MQPVAPAAPVSLDIIAEAWRQALAPAGFRQGNEQSSSILRALTQQVQALLLVTPLDREAARRIGADLVSLCQERPRTLAISHTFLTHAADVLLPSEARGSAHPLLAELLSEMTLGFLEAQGREARTVSRLLFNRIGHDLHGSLSVVLGFARLLMRGLSGPLTEQQHTDLEAIHTAGLALHADVEALLEAGKVETGALHARPEWFELAALLDEAAAEIAPLVQQNGNRLTVTHAEEAPPIWCDRFLLHHVLRVLLSNAARFTVGGTVTLVATYEATATGSAVCIEVQDSGIGITPARLQAVLPGEGAPRPDVAPGSLWTSFHLCRLLGGTLHVASTVGEGSRATVRLPLLTPPA